MKYTIQQLALRMSERTGVPAEKCEAFVRQLFADVEARLIAEGKAEIEGFATFSNVGGDNGQAELTFVPSETVGDNVNSAFSMFEPETLNPDVTTEMLESVSVPNVEPVEAEPQSGDTITVKAKANETTVSVESVSKAKDEVISQEVNQPGEPEPAEPSAEPTADTARTTEPVEEEPEPVEQKPEPIVETKEPVAEAAEQVEKPEPIPAPVVPKSMPLVEESEENNADDDNESDGRPSSLMLFFIGLIVGLAVGATLTFLYMSSMMTTAPAVE